MIELYGKVRDKITGITGTVVDDATVHDGRIVFAIEPDDAQELDENDPLFPFFQRTEDELELVK